MPPPFSLAVESQINTAKCSGGSVQNHHIYQYVNKKFWPSLIWLLWKQTTKLQNVPANIVRYCCHSHLPPSLPLHFLSRTGSQILRRRQGTYHQRRSSITRMTKTLNLSQLRGNISMMKMSRKSTELSMSWTHNVVSAVLAWQRYSDCYCYYVCECMNTNIACNDYYCCTLHVIGRPI